MKSLHSRSLRLRSLSGLRPCRRAARAISAAGVDAQARRWDRPGAGARTQRALKRIEKLEYQLSLERRLSVLEARSVDAETKFERGIPLAASEWIELCERLRQPLRMDDWPPAHSTWRGGR